MLSKNTCSYAVDHLHVFGFDFFDFRAKLGRGHSDFLLLFLHGYIALIHREMSRNQV
jgi:hypothetical protein